MADRFRCWRCRSDSDCAGLLTNTVGDNPGQKDKGEAFPLPLLPSLTALKLVAVQQHALGLLLAQMNYSGACSRATMN